MSININGNDVELKCTVYTLFVYEQEFGSDLIADVMGSQLSASGDDSNIDISKLRWCDVIKALWAMLKSDDEKTPRFQKWISSKPEVQVMDAMGAVSEAIVDGCFHGAEPSAD